MSEFSWVTGVVRFVSEISGIRGLPTLPQNSTATVLPALSQCAGNTYLTHMQQALLCAVGLPDARCMPQWVVSIDMALFDLD